jgi:hypothetical protein
MPSSMSVVSSSVIAPTTAALLWWVSGSVSFSVFQ